LLIFTP